MKKILLLVCLSCLISCHSNNTGSYLSGIATLPSFDMQLTDSINLFHAKNIPDGKPIVMMYFRPDCPHCQLETQNLVKDINQLRGFQIYLLTGASISDAKAFAHKFTLDQYPDIITVGKDHEHSFAKIFQPSSIPFLALYNANKKLVKVYHGEVPISNLLAAMHG